MFANVIKTSRCHSGQTISISLTSWFHRNQINTLELKIPFWNSRCEYLQNYVENGIVSMSLDIQLIEFDYITIQAKFVVVIVIMS